MISAVFDFLCWALDLGWGFLTSALGLGWKLLTALLDLGAWGLSAAGQMLLSPFTRGVDSLWDAWQRAWGSWDLGSLVAVALTVLLTACAILFLIAAGENLYRKYRHKE